MTTTRRFLEFERLDHCPGCVSHSIATCRQPDIAQCADCQLLFRNPRPTQSEIARSYDTGGTFEKWQEEATPRTAMWERRMHLVRRFQPNGKLLDVGTGDGRFLQMCRAQGYCATGTEVSAAGAAYAQHKGLDVKMGQITEIALPLASFDVVTIWHVLEHVPEPYSVLRKISSLLRPGGYLVVAVPNEENFFVHEHAGKAKASPFGPLQFGREIHLTYFRPRTLQRTLRSSGLQLFEFGVDDVYYVRDLKMRARLLIQQSLARIARWHFAVGMYAVCRRWE